MRFGRESHLVIGKTLGRYEIVGRLGGGGMGEVFRAHDSSLGRDVALKVLCSQIRDDPDRLHRFEQEARAASSLNHPHIVTIHDVGESDGLRYLAMELIEGETLRARLAGRPLPLRDALSFAVQIAEGLAKAHAAGIVHRDLKPENVMLTREGAAKIVDFGLAKQNQARVDPEGFTEDRTSPGALLGTVGYMSPEQAAGRPADFQSDQFALGSVLYEMLTGQRAFRKASDVQTLASIIEDDPEPIRSCNAAVPPPVAWFVERCLSKAPEDRFASTLDLARELRDLRDHLREAEAWSSVTSPVQPRATTRRGAPAVVAGLALVLGLAVVALTPSLREAARPWLGRPSVPMEKHLAVLPFATTGGDPADPPLCAGLAETLTSKLTLLETLQGALSVVPASDIREGAIASVEQARRAFGVTLAVTGSLQRSKDRLRLTANLVDARTLRQLRAVTLDTRADDLASLQDDVVAEVARMLEVEVRPETRRALRAGETSVGGAYEHYLRGLGHLQRYEKVEGLEAAVSSFQRALAQDPGYALAYAGLAEAYVRRWDVEKTPDWMELARKSARRALELNDLLAPVHVTLGFIHSKTGQPESAVLEFEAASKLDPSSSDAYRELGRTYEAMNRPEEAEASFRRAVSLRPALWSNHNALGVFYIHRARYEEAIAPLERVLELTPDNVRGFNNLGAAYQYQAKRREATAAFERSIVLKPTYQAYANLGTLYFFQGRYAEAVAMGERAVELNSKQQRAWGNLADAYRWAPGFAGKAPDAYRHAIELARSEARVNPKDAGLHASLAGYWARLGERSKAAEAIGAATRLEPRNPGVLFRAALVYELGGERARALEALALARAGGYSLEEIANEPELGKLRQDPRYAGVVSTATPAPSSEPK
jgi:eukaryotic-like serine/threonine-protein kinase